MGPTIGVPSIDRFRHTHLFPFLGFPIQSKYTWGRPSWEVNGLNVARNRWDAPPPRVPESHRQWWPTAGSKYPQTSCQGSLILINFLCRLVFFSSLAHNHTKNTLSKYQRMQRTPEKNYYLWIRLWKIFKYRKM